ncbi:unnamed protein product, partial [Trichogramma brassicae]
MDAPVRALQIDLTLYRHFLLFNNISGSIGRIKTIKKKEVPEQTSRERNISIYRVLCTQGHYACTCVLDFITSTNIILTDLLDELKTSETGDEEPAYADVPGLVTYLRGTNLDYGYTTQPESQACLNQPNRQCSWTR